MADDKIDVRECMKQREGCQNSMRKEISQGVKDLRDDVNAAMQGIREDHASGVKTFHEALASHRQEITETLERGRKSREVAEGRIFDRLEQSGTETSKAVQDIATSLAGITTIVNQNIKQVSKDQESITSRIEKVEEIIARPAKFAMYFLGTVVIGVALAILGPWAVKCFGPKDKARKTEAVKDERVP